MADESVLHRRLLGRGLEELRTSAGVSLNDAAEQIARSTTSVWRFEQGKTMIDALQLRTLCALYGASPEQRARLENLRELARRPAWWSHLGPRPTVTAGLLSMEDLAWRIREFDHSAIPGLLQTPDYARAIIEAVEPGSSRSDIDTAVALRMERQAKVWAGQEPPEALFLIDEAALWRMPGTPEARRAQLGRLHNPPPTVTLQIVPFSAGPHPSLGTYLIFDLKLDATNARGVYVEGSAAQKGYITEDEPHIEAYELVFEQTRAKALPPKLSAQRLVEMMKELPDD
ncbi:helix-turn-helix domain-containing protein [Flindersiella endophytica]